MKREFAIILRCPKCKGALDLETSSKTEDVEEGSLYCQACNRDYPIVCGIPDML